MPRILGIETSRELCSAAVFDAGAIWEDTRIMERAHNEHILAMIDGLMASAVLKPADLDGVAFGCGPGSFTGIRIAASVAQAIAFGADARILPVSSTMALARAALATGRLRGDGMICSIRSRRDAWYLAGFRVEAGKLHRSRADCLVFDDPGWPETGAGWAFVGDRPGWLDAQLVCHDNVSVSAALIAEMGAQALAAGGGADAEFGLPVYVSGDSPWRPSGPTAAAPSVLSDKQA